MKIRKFYPSHVLRRLTGKRLSDLDAANRHALNLGLRRSRKTGVVITVVDNQIDVRSAADLGRIMLGDLKAVMQKTLSVHSTTSPVLVHDEF